LGDNIDSPALFLREFAGAIKDKVQILLSGKKRRNGIIEKDLKYVSIHFWEKDLLIKFVLKPKHFANKS
jgi:hypothetical protein